MNFFAVHDLGFQWHYLDYFVFLGNQKADLTSIQHYFPHFEVLMVKQVHGDRVVRASNEIVEADAHYSPEPFKALHIKTADCMPIFAIDILQKNIVAVHAGWRGVASQITTKAIQQLTNLGGNPKDIRVVIGPHIRKQSFEIDEPVLVQLIDSLPVEFNHSAAQLYESSSSGKYKIDLESIVRAQIASLKVPPENIDSLLIDTLTDSSWHSFRRDKDQSGRNISFVARIRD